jgi:hypothetical protein
MWPMWCLVPGEDSSTGNVTGGRKPARYVLEAVANHPITIWVIANSPRSMSVACPDERQPLDC